MYGVLLSHSLAPTRLLYEPIDGSSNQEAMMTRVLVTGGNGGLGRLVVSQLGQAGYTVRVMSRRPAPSTANSFEWAQADITTGNGLRAALAGSDVVVHAASSAFKRTRQTDVDGTQRLIEQARAAGVAH